jgi:hypothetical protein
MAEPEVTTVTVLGRDVGDATDIGEVDGAGIDDGLVLPLLVTCGAGGAALCWLAGFQLGPQPVTTRVSTPTATATFTWDARCRTFMISPYSINPRAFERAKWQDP